MSILNPYTSLQGSQGGSGSLPAGIITMWSGAVNDIPEGWALCDGTNGTPDLQGKFVLGASETHTIGETGGEEEVTLTEEQMPEHNHLYSYDGSGNNAQKASTTSMFVAPVRKPGDANNWSTTSVGSSQPHNNLTPYYVLCYIMKL